MINFIICKRSAQPGLCAEDISETRVYGVPMSTETINVAQFAKHIASHGSVYKRADIVAVLLQTVDCLRELLLEGKRINLGDLGTFGVTFKTRGAETEAEFTTDNIISVKVDFQPGVAFENMRADANFNLVPRKKDQELALRKQKGLDEEEEEEKAEGGSEQD